MIRTQNVCGKANFNFGRGYNGNIYSKSPLKCLAPCDDDLIFTTVTKNLLNMENSADPDEKLNYAASHLGLRYL